MFDKNKLRVLLCSPKKGAVGGISRWTTHILKHYNSLSNSLIEMDHYYTRTKGVFQSTSKLQRLKSGLMVYIPFLSGLKEKTSNKNYDVVHIVSSASISLIRDIFSLKIIKRNGIKTVVHFRFGRIPDLYENKNWEQKLLNTVVTLADKVIVIDERSYNTLCKNGFTNIELLPNPIAKKLTDIVSNNKHLIKDERKLVFAGHVVVNKGVFELIEACKDLVNIKLMIIGKVTDAMRNDLISCAGSNHAQWLEIAGEKSYEKTITEMLTAGIFILPTYTEGFPNVILESMACACPIITTNVGAIPEMLDIKNGNKHGICIEPKNVEQLSIAIKTMLDNREYAVSCGLRAQKRVNELYSMDIVWKQMEKIWKSAL